MLGIPVEYGSESNGMVFFGVLLLAVFLRRGVGKGTGRDLWIRMEALESLY